MGYLLWGLLNIGLLLLFVIYCIKTTKLIRQKIGLFACIIFGFGCLSFVGYSNKDDDNKEPNSNHIKTWKFVKEDSTRNYFSYFLDIELEKTLVSEYALGIKYGKDQQGTNIPISAYSSITGFVSGINWKPSSIVVNRTNDNNKFVYFVTGRVEWKLLGVRIFVQVKDYKGIAVTK